MKQAHDGHGMVVIQTSKCDCFTRLWCCVEIMLAHDQDGVQLHTAMSDAFADRMIQRLSIFTQPGLNMTAEQCIVAAGVCINTLQAKCSNPSDEFELVNQVLAHDGQSSSVMLVAANLNECTGGFSRLDSVLGEFFMGELPRRARDMLGTVDRQYGLQQMLALLDDPDTQTRIDAAQRVGGASTGEELLLVLPHMQRLLKDKVMEVRVAAVEGLTSHSVVSKLSCDMLVEHVTRPVIEALWDRSCDVCRAIIKGITTGPLVDQLTAPALVEHIVQPGISIASDSDFFWDRDSQFGQIIAEGISGPKILNKIPHRTILQLLLPGLMELISCSDADARQVAKVALRSKGLLSKLSAENVLLSIVQPLVLIVVDGQEGLEQQIDVRKVALAVVTARPVVTKLSIQQLITHLVNPLVPLLQDKKQVVRKLGETALRCKGLVGSLSPELLLKYVVKPLVVNLDFEQSVVRRAAVIALTNSVLLANLSHDVMEQFIAKKLVLKLKDDDDTVKEAAVQGLQRMKTISGVFIKSTKWFAS